MVWTHSCCVRIVARLGQCSIWCVVTSWPRTSRTDCCCARCQCCSICTIWHRSVLPCRHYRIIRSFSTIIAIRCPSTWPVASLSHCPLTIRCNSTSPRWVQLVNYSMNQFVNCCTHSNRRNHLWRNTALQHRCGSSAPAICANWHAIVSWWAAFRIV